MCIRKCFSIALLVLLQAGSCSKGNKGTGSVESQIDTFSVEGVKAYEKKGTDAVESQIDTFSVEDVKAYEKKGTDAVESQIDTFNVEGVKAYEKSLNQEIKCNLLSFLNGTSLQRLLNEKKGFDSLSNDLSSKQEEVVNNLNLILLDLYRVIYKSNEPNLSEAFDLEKKLEQKRGRVPDKITKESVISKESLELIRILFAGIDGRTTEYNSKVDSELDQLLCKPLIEIIKQYYIIPFEKYLNTDSFDEFQSSIRVGRIKVFQMVSKHSKTCLERFKRKLPKY
ncbi:hypothetical protein [Cardinium endosymbiont of Culicoides punctatus]|uniref:hypothetical protein n=1 Tax=Cardinium endosymbiont of Culicoides punctatus TaxID=2304601 RepID=UPI0010587370|nr:hypothetical protein [Cardinium endosymbiont of Culicoides punctatus]TDG95331.1 hypothetical protein CCPUN_05230 [Cardinium endosymbiont of Culicoides punctatus]